MMPSADLERLRQLAVAYRVDPTLDAVADAIIRRTQISSGANERPAVFEVVSLVVRDEGTLKALMTNGDIPSALYEEMVGAVSRHGPAMPARTLVDVALHDVRGVVGPGAAA